MKLRFAFAAALAAGAFATAAQAAAPVTAKLQTPVEKRVKPVAGGAVFVCEGDTCTAASAGPNTLTAMACRELVRAVGPVSAYGSAAKALTAEKLSACNARAAAKAAAAPAR